MATTAYGTGALAWARRQWRTDTRPHCRECGKVDRTGLIDGLCTRCFCRRLDGVVVGEIKRR